MPAREALGELGLGDDDDPLIGHREAALPVPVEIVTERRAGGDLRVLVDDGAADAAMPADVDAREQDRVLDVREAVDADVGREDAAADAAAADDAAGTDHAVERLAASGAVAARLREDELRRREL